jgi:Tfp pilus assembly protein PilF
MRKLPSWWRVTAISAFASAALTFAVILLGSDPASARAPAVEAPAPVSVTYDPSLLEDTAPAPVVATAVGVAESERVLARRIALRGTRNAAGGLPRLARAAFEEALEHDPSCRPALAGLGKIAFDAGRMREAAEHLEAALRIEPRDTESRAMLARAHEKLGHKRSAARHQRRADENK